MALEQDRLQARDTLLSAQGVVSGVSTLLRACFAAGTKLLTRRGWLPIERLRVGDEVWSKPEGEPQHPGGWKLVEELFQRTGRVWHLHVGGEVIRTTGEHPFYVQGKGWTDACFLQPGDLLCSKDGSTVAVEECYDTEQYETVYNCQVADWHTYYVGDEGWSFDVWAHNARYSEGTLRRMRHADLLEQRGMRVTSRTPSLPDGYSQVYRLSRNGKLFRYGETSNMERRLRQHQAKYGKDITMEPLSGPILRQEAVHLQNHYIDEHIRIFKRRPPGNPIRN